MRHVNARWKINGVAAITAAGKMPCGSFSITALESCPFSVTGEHTICGKCYALRGQYTWPNVCNAQRQRFAFLKECQRQKNYGPFIDIMTAAIEGNDWRTFYVCGACGGRQDKYNGRTCTLCHGRTLKRSRERIGYFRVHDSGDLFSREYTMAWAEICAALPHIQFWIPTRSWQPRNPWRDALFVLANLSNVTVRPSALFFDVPPPRIAGLAAGTSASKVGFNCPSKYQNNTCADCRACWDKTIEITYREH